MGTGLLQEWGLTFHMCPGPPSVSVSQGALAAARSSLSLSPGRQLLLGGGWAAGSQDPCQGGVGAGLLLNWGSKSLEHAASTHWTALTKQKFSDRIIKNVKAAPTVHYSPSGVPSGVQPTWLYWPHTHEARPGEYLPFSRVSGVWGLFPTMMPLRLQGYANPWLFLKPSPESARKESLP